MSEKSKLVGSSCCSTTVLPGTTVLPHGCQAHPLTEHRTPQVGSACLCAPQ